MCVRRPSSERGRSAYRAAVPSRSSARPSASDSPAYLGDRLRPLAQSGSRSHRSISLRQRRRAVLGRRTLQPRRAPRPRVARISAVAAWALVLHAPSSLGALSSFVKPLCLLRVAGLRRACAASTLTSDSEQKALQSCRRSAVVHTALPHAERRKDHERPEGERPDLNERGGRRDRAQRSINVLHGVI